MKDFCIDERIFPVSRKEPLDNWQDAGHERVRFKRWGEEQRDASHCLPHIEDAGFSFAAVDNATKAVSAFGSMTEANANKCGGKLLLKGTRFSVAQLVAELADDGDSVRNVCDNYNLDRKQVVKILHALASGLSAPVA